MSCGMELRKPVLDVPLFCLLKVLKVINDHFFAYRSRHHFERVLNDNQGSVHGFAKKNEQCRFRHSDHNTVERANDVRNRISAFFLEVFAIASQDMK